MTAAAADEISTSRRHDLPPRNQVSQDSEQGFRSWWLGLGSSERDECWSKDSQPGVCSGLSRAVSEAVFLRYSTQTLFFFGRLVGIARGEQEYFDPSGIPTATEACKSNALMRCCKDLGVASELWDPRFIREFKKEYCVEVFAEHVPTKRK